MIRNGSYRIVATLMQGLQIRTAARPAARGEDQLGLDGFSCTEGPACGIGPGWKAKMHRLAKCSQRAGAALSCPGSNDSSDSRAHYAQWHEVKQLRRKFLCTHAGEAGLLQRTDSKTALRCIAENSRPNRSGLEPQLTLHRARASSPQHRLKGRHMAQR